MEIKRDMSKHSYLQCKMIKVYSDKGYTCSIEQELDNHCRVDVYVFNKEQKIAIECQINASEKQILNKINKYKDYFDKLIFCFPTRGCFLKKRIQRLKSFNIEFVFMDIRDVKITDDLLNSIISKCYLEHIPPLKKIKKDG